MSEDTYHLEQDGNECADWVDQCTRHQTFQSDSHPSHWLGNHVVPALALHECHVVGAGKHVISDHPWTYKVCCKMGKYK